MEEFADFPWLIKEIAGNLFEADLANYALKYFEMYRSLTDEPDAEALVLQGRCHRQLQDDSAVAEECFLMALEADENNIAARFELAKMYESAHEQQEAFILINEALSLEAQQLLREEDLDVSRYVLDDEGRPIRMRSVPKPSQPRARHAPGSRAPRKPREPREWGRYRPRRLGRAAQRQQYEQQVTDRLREKYRVCRELRSRVAAGDDEAVVATYMDAAKELVDDFRSFKDFYPWEKYLNFIGYTKLFAPSAAGGDKLHVDRNLAAMAERLQQGVNELLFYVPGSTCSIG